MCEIWVRTFYAQISCVENMFNTRINVLTNEVQIYECHLDFASSNKYVFQMCFQCTILMCEMYKLWMDKFCTVCIIKSWDAKFVMLVLDAKNIFPMHFSNVKTHCFVLKLLEVSRVLILALPNSTYENV